MEKSVDLISTERISRCCIQRGNKSFGGYERTSVEVKEMPFPCETQKRAIVWPKAFAGNVEARVCTHTDFFSYKVRYSQCSVSRMGPAWTEHVSALWVSCICSLPSVLAMPVFTLSVQMWLIRFSCSGLASTTILIFHRVWIAICRDGKVRAYISAQTCKLCCNCSFLDFFSSTFLQRFSSCAWNLSLSYLIKGGRKGLAIFYCYFLVSL